jgi:hypothetical protein
MNTDKNTQPKASRAQHSPTTHTDVVMDLIAQYDELNRHAQALADALRDMLADAGSIHPETFFRARAKAKAALAAWEKSK